MTNDRERGCDPEVRRPERPIPWLIQFLLYLAGALIAAYIVLQVVMAVRGAG